MKKQLKFFFFNLSRPTVIVLDKTTSFTCLQKKQSFEKLFFFVNYKLKLQMLKDNINVSK